MKLNWRNLAVCVGMGICLFALICSPPVGVALAAALILAPVLLFGLVMVPQSLWPAVDLELSYAAPILGRAGLFQRPPPFSLR